MEIILGVALLAAAVTGALVAIFLAGMAIRHGVQRAQARRMRETWEGLGRRARFGPVPASCSGLRSAPQQPGYVGGVVGIADDHLVFTGLSTPTFDIDLPVENLRWLDRQWINQGDALPLKDARRVVVHFEGAGGWRVYTFRLRDLEAFAQALSAASGLPLHESLINRLDLLTLSVSAVRMKQDIYGQWQTDLTDQLYLAPDRLLFAWQDAILLTDIRQVSVYQDSRLLDRLNPFGADLLRIDYESGGGSHTVGFRVSGAQTWATRIAGQAGIMVDGDTGRKKKS